MDINYFNISDDIIFHVIMKDEVNSIINQKYYAPEKFSEEGFIHFSCKDQVAWVLDKFYKNSRDCYILGVDLTKLTSELRYEGASVEGDSELLLPERKDFPHLYGRLNMDAVVHLLETDIFYNHEMDEDIEELINHYGFGRLPVEGTYFKENFSSKETTEAGGVLSTAMIGLYTKHPVSMSCFHRLTADEVWHFYGGDPIRLVLLNEDGTEREVILGSDFSKGHQLQYVIPAGVWQAGEVLEGGRYALFGCTMAPGFKPSGFEAGVVSELVAKYPTRKLDILKFNINGNHKFMD